MIIDSLFEKKVLACLMRNDQFCSVSAWHLTPDYFEGAVNRNMAKLSIEFYKNHGAHLTHLGFIHGIKALVGKKTIDAAEVSAYADHYKALLDLDLSDWRYVMQEIVTFIKSRETRNLIEDAVKHFLPKNDFKGIAQRWNKIESISVHGEVEPVDYWDEDAIMGRAERRKLEAAGAIKGITTGIKRMDESLPGGGWRPKEFYTISGGPKRGKTMALLWFAYVASLQGRNVPYFSCEVSREVIEDRLDAMASSNPIGSLAESAEEIAERVALGRPAGKILIYEYPTKQLTVKEVERQILKLRMRAGIDVDMVVTDYAQIMRPSFFSDDFLRNEASIMEDHRAFAGKYKIPVLTGAQINRSGANKAVVDGTDTSGAFEKVMIVDGNITLSATRQEVKDGILRVRLSEMRNAASKSFLIRTDFGMGKFYKEFIEEEEEE